MSVKLDNPRNGFHAGQRRIEGFTTNSNLERFFAKVSKPRIEFLPPNR